MGVVEADPLLEDADKGEYSAIAAAVERINAVMIPAPRNERLESTRQKKWRRWSVIHLNFFAFLIVLVPSC